jgi:hypothetical protein
METRSRIEDEKLSTETGQLHSIIETLPIKVDYSFANHP